MLSLLVSNLFNAFMITSLSRLQQESFRKKIRSAVCKDLLVIEEELRKTGNDNLVVKIEKIANNLECDKYLR